MKHTSMPKFKPARLTQLDILGYALTGASTDLGTGVGFIAENDEEQLKADIEKIKKRLLKIKEKQGD